MFDFMGKKLAQRATGVLDPDAGVPGKRTGVNGTESQSVPPSAAERVKAYAGETILYDGYVLEATREGTFVVRGAPSGSTAMMITRKGNPRLYLGAAEILFRGPPRGLRVGAAPTVATETSAEDLPTGRAPNPAASARISYEKVKAYYGGSFECQREALLNLGEQATHDDPPPFVERILIALTDVCIGAAIAGIGAHVSGSLKTMPGVSDATQKIFADTVKEATKAAVKKGGSLVGEHVEKLARELDGDPQQAAKVFFYSQRMALVEAKVEAEVALADLLGQFEQGAPEVAAAMKVLEGAMATAFAHAYDVQRREGVQAFAVYTAQCARGVTTSKTNGVTEHRTDMRMSKMPNSPKRDRGVLRVWGTLVPDQAPRIIRAEILGLSAPLRKELAGMAFGEMKVPMFFQFTWVSGPVHAIKFMRSEDLGGIQIDPESIPALVAFGTDPSSVPDAADHSQDGNLACTGAENIFASIAHMKPPLE